MNVLHDSVAEAACTRRSGSIIAATDDDSLLPIDLPAVARKKVTAAFEGGRLLADGRVLLLRGVERQHGLAEGLAGRVVNRRDPSRIDHEIVAMVRQRMFLIPAGGQDRCQLGPLAVAP